VHELSIAASIVDAVTESAAGYPGDRGLAIRNIHEIRPGIDIFETSAKTGQGMHEWLDYLAALRN